jgi:hypothetical protein
MSEFLSETEGCDLLTRLFRSRGYSITRNLPFREYGVDFHIDGWDAKARVGFEFLTSEDEDHDDLSLAEYKVLSDAQQRGELALFIIDEVEPLSAADLTSQAEEFLDEVAEAVQARATSRGRARGKAVLKKKSQKKAVPKTTKRPTGKVAKKPVKKIAKKTAKKKARRAK